MAAYAGVVSIMHLIEQIKLYHARHLVFDDKQLRQLESLHVKVCFLQDFLESYSQGGNNEANSLDSQIVDATNAAEDIIEYFIVDDIHERSGKGSLRKKLTNNFSQDLQKIIEDMETIEREAMEFKEKSRVFDHSQPQNLQQVSSSKLPISNKETVVGIDSTLEMVMENLTGGQSNRQNILITGMGGIGKTTLAVNVYNNPLIVEYFDIRGRVTISQEYNTEEIFCGLLRDLNVISDKENSEYHQLGEKLYKHLSGRRYLIVLDDIWSLEAWDKVTKFLPDNNNGSRVIVTTRLSNLANDISSSGMYPMRFLDENESWHLLQKQVFLQDSCPLELVEIGRKIAKNCKGLPLSIVVIGGLLAKSINQEYWKSVAKDTSTIVNSDDGDHCLKILSMSYYHLPICLKPCFLYLGAFPEDHNILVAELIRLWVAEGFLKPSTTKTLEEVANDYLKDLISRNLVLVTKFGSFGNVKFCRVHDLLRDLCLKEARKQRFLYLAKEDNPDISKCDKSQRRVAVHSSRPYLMSTQEVDNAMAVSSLRSLMCNFMMESPPSLNDVKLLRVWTSFHDFPPDVFYELVNLRYVNHGAMLNSKFDNSISMLWNLQTIISGGSSFVSSDIWEMPQLRHVMINHLYVDDPRGGETDNIVLANLQTLMSVFHFKCTEVVLRKIPNVKKLKLYYTAQNAKILSNYCLQNLGRLQKLESLYCMFVTDPAGLKYFQYLELSLSLKKLTLVNCISSWEEMGRKIGSLPRLEKLTLDSAEGGKTWNSIEGHFLSLKYLEIEFSDLVWWTAESSHFPCLEHLLLLRMLELKEIPSEIGDIPTLRSINVTRSSDSVIASANRILEEQREFGNEDIQLINRRYGSSN